MFAQSRPSRWHHVDFHLDRRRNRLKRNRVRIRRVPGGKDSARRRKQTDKEKSHAHETPPFTFAILLDWIDS